MIDAYFEYNEGQCWAGGNPFFDEGGNGYVLPEDFWFVMEEMGFLSDNKTDVPPAEEIELDIEHNTLTDTYNTDAGAQENNLDKRDENDSPKDSAESSKNMIYLIMVLPILGSLISAGILKY